MSDSKNDLISVFIDGEEVKVPKGLNLIEAAARIGKEVPHYCYHPKLSVVGNCRMCLVELGMPGKDRATGEPILNEDGSPKVMWMPKPAIACATGAAPGMHMRTQSEMVKECRNGVMEFLLVNHPLDCPICDQAGECRLQEFATDYGRGYSRFVETKNVKPKRTRLGPRVMLDDERCILCSRCIRFCQEVAKDDVLGFTDRGSYSTLTCFPGKELANNYSLNTVDICPVGALTSTDFRFKMRVWFLKPVKSIDTESSVGANTEVWSREGKIYRITPRRNDAVNDTWMADSGRALYKQVEAENRIHEYCIGGQSAPAGQALQEAARLLKQGRTALVVNGRASVEEQFRLRELLEACGSADQVVLVAHTGEGDGLLVSSDRTPNVRGALITGLTDSLPVADLGDLGQQIDAGDVDTLLVVNEDPLAHGLSAGQLDRLKVVFIGSHRTETASRAQVVLPGLTVFEKSGSFVNQQFRLQRFHQAIPGPVGLQPETALLGQLIGLVRGEKPPAMGTAAIWTEMSSRVPALANLTFASIGDEGRLLDPGPFAGMPFVEGESLHFKPTATAGASRS